MKYIHTNTTNINFCKTNLFNFHKKYTYYKTNTKNSEKNINLRNNKKPFILIIKILIYCLLFPLYLTKNTNIEFRKLDSLQIIEIQIVGEGYLNYISNKSDLIPKYIFVNNNTRVNYNKKYFNFKSYKVRDLILTYNITNQQISFNSLFADLPHLLKVDLSLFEEKVIDLGNMFENCINLQYVKFGNFDTSSVTNMQYMFYGTGLKFLDLSKLDTKNVINMDYMFAENHNLLYLNLKNFNTEKVQKMTKMFYNCNSLMYLNLYSFKEKAYLEMDDIVDETPDDLIYCIIEGNAQNIADKLEDKITENSCQHECFLDNKKLIPKTKNCVDNCEQDSTYKYDYYDLCYIYVYENGTIVDEVTEEPTEKQTEEPTEKQTEKPTEEQTEESTEKQTEKPTEEQTEEQTVKQTEEATEKHTEETTEKQSEESTQEQSEKSTEKQTEEQTQKQTEKQTDDPTGKQENKPTEDKAEMTVGEINEPYEGKIESKNVEIMENCTSKDFFKGLCHFNNEALTTEKKDNIITSIVNNIINGNLDTLLNEILYSDDKKDFYLKEDDMIFEITTTENQNNKEYDNMSTIYLGECENILKDKYGIAQNDSLIILKIDYFMEGLLIPIIGYEVFHPKNKSKLNLDYCKDILINYNIPVSINEDELSKYDPNSDYYNDECTLSKSEDGTDITLNDRQKEYNDNNMSLCEHKCNFTEYNISSKTSKCMCEIKSKIYTISEILNSKETVSKDFNTENSTTSLTVLNPMKCYNSLFSKYGLLKNIGNYILLLITLIFVSSGILFYKVGYIMLCNEIAQIIKMKGENNKEKFNIYKYDKKEKKSKIKRKAKKSKSSKSKSSKSNPKKRKSIKKFEDLINTGSKNHKSVSKLKLINAKKNHKMDLNNPMIEKSQIILNEMQYNDYEKNYFSYKEALENDKRSFMEYYKSLVKTKHPLIFSLIPIKDYNSMITKVDILLISFAVLYATNALFFNEKTIHQIYEDKGAYNMRYFLPQTILAFIIGHIIVIILKYIFLSERHIMEIKKQETKDNASVMIDKVKRCLIIKYIIFYVAGSIFLILFWYYLSSFGAVYQNSQIFLIINTFLSSFISIIYPLFINVFPAVIRAFSLNNTNREIFYKISKIIQII